jgi:hypothetical protein
VYSYQYSQGQWSSIEDPLQGKSLSDSDYRSAVGDAKRLVCSGLPFVIYSYNPLDPLPKPKVKPIVRVPPYKFCCVLDAGFSECFVWVPDLPDLLQLLHNLQVVREQPYYLDKLIEVAHDTLLAMDPKRGDGPIIRVINDL